MTLINFNQFMFMLYKVKLASRQNSENIVSTNIGLPTEKTKNS